MPNLLVGASALSACEPFQEDTTESGAATTSTQAVSASFTGVDPFANGNGSYSMCRTVAMALVTGTGTSNRIGTPVPNMWTDLGIWTT